MKCLRLIPDSRDTRVIPLAGRRDEGLASAAPCALVLDSSNAHSGTLRRTQGPLADRRQIFMTSKFCAHSYFLSR